MKGESTYEDIKRDEKKKILGTRKRQILSRLHTEENIRTIKTSKKPLRRLWIVVIILVVVGLIAAYNPGGLIPGYKPPWAYVSYDIEKSGMSQTIEEYYPLYWTENDLSLPLNKFWFTLTPAAFAKALFEEDFTDSPAAVLYGLIAILILGLAVTIFEFIDKKRDFSILSFATIQCILYSAMIIPCVFILSNLLKFVGTYILMAHHYYEYPVVINMGGVEISRFNSLLYPVPYLLVVIMFILIAIAATAMETDLKTLLNEREKNVSYKKSSSVFDMWS